MIEVYKPQKVKDIPVYELYKYVDVYNKLQNIISQEVVSYGKNPIRILDLGVGSCNSIEYILDKLNKPSKIYYTGVDINEKNLEFCKEKFENKILSEARRKRVYLEYKLVLADITKDLDKKLDGESYNNILLISVLEFLGNDWKKALDNAYNLLEDSGRMYVAVPYKIPMFLRRLWILYIGVKTIIKEKLRGSGLSISYMINRTREAKNIVNKFNGVNRRDVINTIEDKVKNIEVKTIRPYMDIIIIEK